MSVFKVKLYSEGIFLSYISWFLFKPNLTEITHSIFVLEEWDWQTIVLAILLSAEILYFVIGHRFLKSIMKIAFTLYLCYFVHVFYDYKINNLVERYKPPGIEEDIHSRVWVKQRNEETANLQKLFYNTGTTVVYHFLFLIYLTMFKTVQFAKPNAKQITDQLFIHCQSSDLESLRKIFEEHWHDLNCNTIRNGSSLLHLAIKKNNIKLVELLFNTFDDKIDTSIRDGNGQNGLDLAVKSNKLELFNLVLIHSEADLSSLFLAVEQHQTKMIKSLISNIPRESIGKIIGTITQFCDLIEKSNKKGLKSDDRESLLSEINSQEKVILSELKSIKETKEKYVNEEDPEVIEKNENGLDVKWRRQDFECKVCNILMEKPLQIFGCSNDDFLCSVCVTKEKCCKVCGEDFAKNVPTRRITHERILCSLLGQI